MKKVINGLIYDTETAKPLGECRHSRGYVTIMRDTLFRTENGDYFVYSALTDGADWERGISITHMSFDEAQEWLKEHKKEETKNEESN